MYLIRKYLFLIAALLMVACEQDSPDPDNMLRLRPLTYEEETLLNSSNEFSFELLRMLNEQDPDGNTIFSSFGVGNGIGMAFNIMENRPKEELKNFLRISQVRDIDIHKAYFELGEILNLIDRDVQFTRANSLWINNTQEINPLSGDKIMAYYDADVEYLNFKNSKSVRTINRWVEDRSLGKIKHVLDSLQPDDRSYIINAIHFDVHWNLPFNEYTLENYTFTNLEGSRKSIRNINHYSGEIGYYADESLSLIDIPLGSKQFYLSLIIPEKTGDFRALIRDLDPVSISEYLAGMKKMNKDVLLPKINIDSEVRLKDLFPEFGLTGPIAIIENFYPIQNLFISDFIHKTSINIGNTAENEMNKVDNGTIQPELSQPVIIDRPFIFLVREQFTGAIVFTGKLVNPAS